MKSSVLSTQEITRYQKIIALKEIGVGGQEKLKQSSVLVVGAGGLGAPVLQYLSAMGVGTLGILDNDLIEHKNLPCQILYGTKDLGKHKAIVVKNKLEEMNHLVHYNIHNICLSADNAVGFLQPYDIIVDATDNFYTKYLINDACVILKKKWVYANFNNFAGNFSVFDGKKGPTLRCLYPEKPNSNNDPEGEIGILTGAIGSFMSCEVIKLITGIGQISTGNLKSFNLLTNEIEITDIKANPDNLNITSMYNTGQQV